MIKITTVALSFKETRYAGIRKNNTASLAVCRDSSEEVYGNSRQAVDADNSHILIEKALKIFIAHPMVFLETR